MIFLIRTKDAVGKTRRTLGQALVHAALQCGAAAAAEGPAGDQRSQNSSVCFSGSSRYHPSLQIWSCFWEGRSGFRRQSPSRGRILLPPLFLGPEEPGWGLGVAGGHPPAGGSAPEHPALLPLERLCPELSGMGLPPCWGTGAISLPGTATQLLGGQD